jgi:hypothetical protein
VGISVQLFAIVAQVPRHRPPAADPVETWLYLLIGLGVGAIGLAYSAFWIWMLLHCLFREPDKFFWIWLLVVVPFPGAIVYAVVRVFPQREYAVPAWLRRFTRGRELTRLETAAEQIGNAHQFVQWGNALRDVGDWQRASDAYSRALAKDPQNLPALWGAAQTAERLKKTDDVKRFCGQILERDPQYKFGDVSLAYGRALVALGENGVAREHLAQHCKRWRHPEAVYMLACRCQEDGDTAAARQNLLELMRDINASPAAIARKFGRWKSLARKMLKQLPRQ